MEILYYSVQKTMSPRGFFSLRCFLRICEHIKNCSNNMDNLCFYSIFSTRNEFFFDLSYEICRLVSMSTLSSFTRSRNNLSFQNLTSEHVPTSIPLAIMGNSTSVSNIRMSSLRYDSFFKLGNNFWNVFAAICRFIGLSAPSPNTYHQRMSYYQAVSLIS